MKCEKCGATIRKLDNEIIFCPHCGIYINYKIPRIEKPNEINLASTCNREAAKFYFNNLIQCEEALDYLHKRGITNDVIVREGLGFSNPKKSLKRFLGKQGFSNSVMKAAGLLNSKGGDKFWDKRILFPIMSNSGTVYGFSGRTLDPSAKQFKYVNTASTPLFDKGSILYGMHHCKMGKPFVLCEGQMDVIASTDAGVANAVASMGTAFTKVHARAVHCFTDTIYLMMDSDDAGKKATRSAAEICTKEGLKVFVVDLGKYKDPDELKNALGSQALRQKLAKSFSLIEWLKATSTSIEELALFI